MSTEIPYHFAHLLPVLKKISLKSDFFTVFYVFFVCFFFVCLFVCFVFLFFVFLNVYSPRQGQTTH